jgi:hypothetical protein
MGDIFTHRIEVFTADLVITGSYELALYRRMSDALNGEQRRYIPLLQATIGPLGQSAQLQRIPTLLFDRSEAIVVSALAEAQPPTNYPRDEQIRGMIPITAMFFTSAFAVRGTFYRRPNQDLTETLERMADDFLPLRRVQVFALHGAMAPVERDFAALACRRIVALYQLAEAPADASGETPPHGPA